MSLANQLDTKRENFRDGIIKFEECIKQVPGVLGEDPFPLVHTFGDGLYIRELHAPPRALIITKIHKKTHPFFLLKGDVSVLTEDGIQRIKAPYSGITKAGTKRVCYTHEDTIWTTVHKTDETDLDKIEEEVIAKNFDEIDNIEEQARIKDFIDVVAEEV